MFALVKSLYRNFEQKSLSGYRLSQFVRKNIFGQNVWKPRRSYAQLAEDLALQKLQGRCRSRLFLDVGCFHPLQYSNTRLLKEANWQGVHVDASKKSIALFARTYPEDLVINAIISTSKDIDFSQLATNEIWAKNRVLPRKDSSVQASDVAVPELEEDDRNFLERSHRESDADETPVQILSPGELYDTVASRIDPALASIGLLNLDIEGGELDFLRAWPFDHCDFDLICVENHARNLDAILASDLHKWLDARGYELAWFFEFSTIYRKKT